MDVVEVIHGRLSCLVASCVKRILSFWFLERKAADYARSAAFKEALA